MSEEITPLRRRPAGGLHEGARACFALQLRTGEAAGQCRDSPRRLGGPATLRSVLNGVSAVFFAVPWSGL